MPASKPMVDAFVAIGMKKKLLAVPDEAIDALAATITQLAVAAKSPVARASLAAALGKLMVLDSAFRDAVRGELHGKEMDSSLELAGVCAACHTAGSGPVESAPHILENMSDDSDSDEMPHNLGYTGPDFVPRFVSRSRATIENVTRNTATGLYAVRPLNVATEDHTVKPVALCGSTACFDAMLRLVISEERGCRLHATHVCHSVSFDHPCCGHHVCSNRGSYPGTDPVVDAADYLPRTIHEWTPVLVQPVAGLPWTNAVAYKPIIAAHERIKAEKRLIADATEEDHCHRLGIATGRLRPVVAKLAAGNPEYAVTDEAAALVAGTRYQTTHEFQFLHRALRTVFLLQDAGLALGGDYPVALFWDLMKVVYPFQQRRHAVSVDGVLTHKERARIVTPLTTPAFFGVTSVQLHRVKGQLEPTAAVGIHFLMRGANDSIVCTIPLHAYTKLVGLKSVAIPTQSTSSYNELANEILEALRSATRESGRIRVDPVAAIKASINHPLKAALRAITGNWSGQRTNGKCHHCRSDKAVVARKLCALLACSACSR